MKFVKRGVALGLASAVMLGGCSGGSDAVVQGAIEALPDIAASGDTIFVTVGDLDLAAELADIDRSAVQEPIQELIVPLTIPDPDVDRAIQVILPNAFALSVAQENEDFSWSMPDVAQYAEVYVSGNGPPIFAVSVKPTDGAELGTAGLTDMGDGIFSVGEGADGTSNLEGATPLRRLGEPWRATEKDDWTVVSNRTAPVEMVRDGARSLSEHDAIAGVAEQLDAEGVYAAVIVADADFGAVPMAGFAPDPAEVQGQVEEIWELAVPQQFTAVGIGPVNSEDEEDHLVVVYHFSSSESAADAVAPVQRVWEEGVSLTTGRPFGDHFVVHDVRAEGSQVVVQVDGDGPSAFQRMAVMAQQGELIFAHQ